MTPSPELLYSSANGDRWLLVRDVVLDQVLVRHEANSASGGRVTETEAAAFLRQAGAGPEHAAVRAALEQPAPPGASESARPPRSETPVHDWLLPRLQRLVDEAIDAGFDPLKVTAVLTDILASTNLDHQPPTDLSDL